MSKFKNNNDIRLYYTDTDSAIVNKPLPNSFVNDNELGKFKLEHVIDKAIFLAPKLYCFLTESGDLVTKTRGLSHDIKLDFNDFNNLLFKDSEIIKIQNKWFKNFYEGTIKIDDLPYSIKYTDNKRILIFDDGKLSKTIPFF
nr:hypothetical protein [Marasmius tenuissimus]